MISENPYALKGNITHPIGEAVRGDYDETDDLVERSDNAGREKRYEYDMIGRRQKSLILYSKSHVKKVRSICPRVLAYRR